MAVVVTSVVIAGLTGTVEATSLEAVAEAKVVLGAVGPSVTVLLMDALGAEQGLKSIGSMGALLPGRVPLARKVDHI
jgi:hypothetical protein